MNIRRFATILILASFPFLTHLLRAQSLDIIPRPLEITEGKGKFRLTPQTRIYYFTGNREMRSSAAYLAAQLKAATGFDLKVLDATSMVWKNFMFLNYIREEELGEDGYVLRVEKDGINLEASRTPGFFYAVQTLLQLFPPEVFRRTPAGNGKWEIPCITITDTARYRWRGMMLDVSRHFFSKEFVKRFIDFLAMHKMNRFHWHLNDDQGWRIEIKRYPRLGEIAAWRVDHEDVSWNARPPQQPDEKATYGGFYTQKEIKDIVRYAQERFITIVPEIEMPAHSTAVLSAYPQFSCTGGPFTLPPGGIWPIKDIYCAGNDSTYEFLQNILTEVIDLFPGEYVHIGGDEADKTEWKRCPKCQARIKNEHLKDEAELQSYFVKRIEAFLRTRGKRLIGWDEILDGGLAPEATVMSWRGTRGGITAARSGHDVIMSPNTNCYFDYYQGDRSLEPTAIGGFLPIRAVYSYEPTPDSLAPAEAQHLLGVQANLWTEYIPTPEKAEYMILPRIAAIAEVAWSTKLHRDWNDFTDRLRAQLVRYASMGAKYAMSLYAVAPRDSFDVTSWTRFVMLDSEIGAAKIRYTLDGTPPTSRSRTYIGPIPLTRTTTLRAATFSDDTMLGPVTTQTYNMSRRGINAIAIAQVVDSTTTAEEGRKLIDNVQASVDQSDKRWYQVRGRDFEAVIDLGQTAAVTKLTAGFLHESVNMIFLPPVVEYAVSEDGVNFQTMATQTSETLQKEPRAFRKEFAVDLSNVHARYVRVHAKNPGPGPSWHLHAGDPTWLFIDEIFVE